MLRRSLRLPRKNGYKVDIYVHATAQAGVSMKGPAIIFEYLMLPGP